MPETSWLGFPDDSLIAGAESLARGAQGAVPAAALHRDLRPVQRPLQLLSAPTTQQECSATVPKAKRATGVGSSYPSGQTVA